MLSVLVVFAFGCTDSSDSAPYSTHPVDDTGTLACNDVITWDSWAHGFFLNNCTSCHSRALLTEDERQKAPTDMNFDTYEGVAENAVAIEYRAVTAEPKYLMPPNIALDLDDRETLGLWIECGLKEN